LLTPADVRVYIDRSGGSALAGVESEMRLRGERRFAFPSNPLRPARIKARCCVHERRKTVFVPPDKEIPLEPPLSSADFLNELMSLSLNTYVALLNVMPFARSVAGKEQLNEEMREGLLEEVGKAIKRLNWACRKPHVMESARRMAGLVLIFATARDELGSSTVLVFDSPDSATLHGSSSLSARGSMHEVILESLLLAYNLLLPGENEDAAEMDVVLAETFISSFGPLTQVREWDVAVALRSESVAALRMIGVTAVLPDGNAESLLTTRVIEPSAAEPEDDRDATFRLAAMQSSGGCAQVQPPTAALAPATPDSKLSSDAFVKRMMLATGLSGDTFQPWSWFKKRWGKSPFHFTKNMLAGSKHVRRKKSGEERVYSPSDAFAYWKWRPMFEDWLLHHEAEHREVDAG
jgi:hypothetical protein